jgi:hypothetical protein
MHKNPHVPLRTFLVSSCPACSDHEPMVASTNHGLGTKPVLFVRGTVCSDSSVTQKWTLFFVIYCLDVNSDSVHICTEASSIALGISPAKSDSGTSSHCDRRPMALPYPYGRRLGEGTPLMLAQKPRNCVIAHPRNRCDFTNRTLSVPAYKAAFRDCAQSRPVRARGTASDDRRFVTRAIRIHRAPGTEQT